MAFIQEQGPLVAPDSYGADIVSGIIPFSGVPLDSSALYAGKFQEIGSLEWVLYKARWDTSYGTRLEEHLRSLEVDTVVVCGCNLPNCPRATLFGASMRDFRTVLVKDATSQTTVGRLADLPLMGIVVLDADQIIQNLHS
jgi:nicotinamidase-related amidase